MLRDTSSLPAGRRVATLLALLLTFATLSACRRAESIAAQQGGGGFPRTVQDAGGRSVTLPAPPRRIVSQTLATDEILFDICDPERLVGVSLLARDPAYSNVVGQATQHGAPAVDTAEDALRLQPDLVFVASYSRAEVIELLQASNAPVFRFSNFDRIADLMANVRTVGVTIGEESKAEALVQRMDARLAAARTRSARRNTTPRVLSFSPSGFTAGAGTLFDDIVRHAGARNEAAERGLTGFPRISTEQVLAWQPDFLVVGFTNGQREDVRRRLLANPAVAASAAAKAGRIVMIDHRALLAASQYVTDAVDALVLGLEGSRASL